MSALPRWAACAVSVYGGERYGAHTLLHPPAVAPESTEKALALVERLLVLGGGVGIRDDAAADLEEGPAAPDQDRADRNIEVHRAIEDGVPVRGYFPEPVAKRNPRGIMVEYLQYELLDSLFKLPEAASLSFIGGTAIRLNPVHAVSIERPEDYPYSSYPSSPYKGYAVYLVRKHTQLSNT